MLFIIIELQKAKSIGLFPFQCLYKTSYVVCYKVYDGLERVVVGINVKIKGAAKEVCGAVGEIKLQRRCHTFTVEKINQAVYIPLLINNDAVANAGSLVDMFGYHLI